MTGSGTSSPSWHPSISGSCFTSEVWPLVYSISVHASCSSLLFVPSSNIQGTPVHGMPPASKTAAMLVGSPCPLSSTNPLSRPDRVAKADMPLHIVRCCSATARCIDDAWWTVNAVLQRGDTVTTSSPHVQIKLCSSALPVLATASELTASQLTSHNAHMMLSDAG